jgi:hypothetical protein
MEDQTSSTPEQESHDLFEDWKEQHTALLSSKITLIKPDKEEEDPRQMRLF